MICPGCGKPITSLSHQISEIVEVLEEPNYLLVTGTKRLCNDYFHECGQRFGGTSDENGALLYPVEIRELARR